MVSTKSKLRRRNFSFISISSLKSVFLIVLLCTISVLANETGTISSEPKVKWSISYQESLDEAKVKNKPVMVKFEASWCVWCEKMENEVFTDPEVIKELEKFVCIKIDVDKQENIAKSYKIRSLPRTIIINTYGEIVGDWLGYYEPSVFYKMLRDTDEYTHTQTGTTKAPKIQQAVDTSDNAANIPDIDPNNTNDLIGLLGYKNAGINNRVIELLIKTGPQILPKVVPALEGKYLGTRIAAWKVVRELTGNKYKYDPWAAASERIQAAEIIKEKLKNRED